MNKINWKIFEGSSFCEEGLAMFVTGELRNFNQLEKYFANWDEKAKEIRRIKRMKLPISDLKRRCRNALNRWGVLYA